MNYKKNKKRHPLAVVIIIICIAAIATAGFLVLTDNSISFAGASKSALAPVTIEGPIKAISLSGAALEYVTDKASREAHSAALGSVIEYAKTNGFNAILYQVARGEEYFCRLNDKEPAKSIADLDKFLNKWDPFAYLCQEASKQGIAVFALFDGSDAAPPDAEVIKQVESKYSVNGSFINNHGVFAGESTISAVYESDFGTLVTPKNLADVYSVELMAADENFAGIMYAEYGDEANAQSYSLWDTAFVSLAKPQPLAYTGTPSLGLTYPQSTSAKVYSSKVFIMGTSDPAQPLTLNGEEVSRLSSLGSFGVLVDVKKGINSFTLSQGENKVNFTINRLNSSGGGGTIQADGTVEAEKGQQVKVTATIASGLYELTDDGKISETFKKGGTATVVESVRTTRSGKKTWAYKLSTGDYVLARNTEILTEKTSPSFTGGTAQAGEFGELITLTGSGTPLAYTAYENNVLTVKFVDTAIDQGFNITGSEFVQSVTTSTSTGTSDIMLQIGDKKLWGWDIRYSEGTTQIFLKYAPQKSTAIGTKPLEGVRVMLDAGHGEDDIGAMGVDGNSAPCEKDVNLQVTLAAKYYLERMGATVLLTREDDNFRTLDERLTEQFDKTPDFFIAIHHNSVELVVDANQAKGAECYYFYKAHEGLAAQLALNVSQNAQRENRGEKYGYFYVTRSTVAPSNLLEVGFMVNPLEYSDVVSQEVIDKTGAGIAMSVLNSVP